MSVDEIPLETENGINLDHPVVILFRKMMLEQAAKEQDSDLFCKKCNTHLPYSPITSARIPDGVDADYRPVFKRGHYCPLCEEYF